MDSGADDLNGKTHNGRRAVTRHPVRFGFRRDRIVIPRAVGRIEEGRLFVRERRRHAADEVDPCLGVLCIDERADGRSGSFRRHALRQHVDRSLIWRRIRNGAEDSLVLAIGTVAQRNRRLFIAAGRDDEVEDRGRRV